jgi:cbb3-type cytochrome oxidase subunit 3
MNSLMDYLSVIPMNTYANSATSSYSRTHLLNDIDISHIQNTIQSYKLQKHTTNSIILNVGLFSVFVLIIWGVLSYAYRKKQRKEVDREKSKEFIEEKIEKIKVILHEKRKEEGKLITELPNLHNNVDVDSMNSQIDAFNFHNSFTKEFI